MGNSIYSKSRVLTPLEQLDDVIATTVRHIEDFRKNPNDFTRDRKLNVTSTIKTTLNMEGQSLNTELIHAFPNMDDRVTASAYEQQKSKLSPKLFEHLLREYNKTNTNHALYEGKYQLLHSAESNGSQCGRQRQPCGAQRQRECYAVLSGRWCGANGR